MKRRYILFTIAYCAGIFLLSDQPEPPIPVRPPFPGSDKIAHAVLYAGLAAVISIGMRRSRQHRPTAQFWLPVFFCVFYGASDEFHQYFVPHRHMDLADIAADGIGALAAQLALFHGVWKIPFRDYAGRSIRGTGAGSFNTRSDSD